MKDLGELKYSLGIEGGAKTICAGHVEEIWYDGL